MKLHRGIVAVGLVVCATGLAVADDEQDYVDAAVVRMKKILPSLLKQGDAKAKELSRQLNDVKAAKVGALERFHNAVAKQAAVDEAKGKLDSLNARIEAWKKHDDLPYPELEVSGAQIGDFGVITGGMSVESKEDDLHFVAEKEGRQFVVSGIGPDIVTGTKSLPSPMVVTARGSRGLLYLSPLRWDLVVKKFYEVKAK